ncbi:hypothetical protein BC834DRAFT_420505 [Gloeopeniophorella convolvens]|nr:hypothetical protein BC834DRAFT_420505 [Gloeopeniophorella convolvens]
MHPIPLRRSSIGRPATIGGGGKQAYRGHLRGTAVNLELELEAWTPACVLRGSISTFFLGPGAWLREGRPYHISATQNDHILHHNINVRTNGAGAGPLVRDVNVVRIRTQDSCRRMTLPCPTCRVPYCIASTKRVWLSFERVSSMQSTSKASNHLLSLRPRVHLRAIE